MPVKFPTGLCVMRHTNISHCPNVSTMLGLFLWGCLFHSSPQLLVSEFSSLYVCFCLAINIIFQAFFFSFLVEPKYEKNLETLHDHLDSDGVYGYLPAINYIQDTIPYPELVKFFEHKKLQEDCSDVRKCVERMITQRDISSFIAPMFAIYVAREMGTVGVGKLVCSLDEGSVSGVLAVVLKGEIHFWTDSTP